MPTVIGQSPVPPTPPTPSGTSFGNLFAYGSSSAPYLFLFKEVNGEFISISTPAGVDSAVRGIAFKPDGTELAVAHDNGLSRLSINSEGSFSFLSTFPSTSGCRCVAYSNNGQEIAAGFNTGVKLRVWKNLVPFPFNTTPPQDVVDVAFSPDRLTLAVGVVLPSDGGAWAYAWHRATEASNFSMTSQFSSPSTMLECRGVVWLSNTRLLCTGIGPDPNVTVQFFSRSGGTISRVPNHTTSGVLIGSSFAAGTNARQARGSRGLVGVPMTNAPWFNLYDSTASLLVRREVGGSYNPTGVVLNPSPTGSITHCDLSSDGKYIAVGGATDGERIYKASGLTYGLVRAFGPGTPTSCAWWPKAGEY